MRGAQVAMVAWLVVSAACSASSPGTALDGGDATLQRACERLAAAACPREGTLAICLEFGVLQRDACQRAGFGAAFEADLQCAASATWVCDINGRPEVRGCPSSVDVRLCGPSSDGGVDDRP
jgi:hypothetical protein